MDSPGKNTRVGCHALLQRIFPTQGLNPCLLCLLLAGKFFTTSAAWEVLLLHTTLLFSFTSDSVVNQKYFRMTPELSGLGGWNLPHELEHKVGRESGASRSKTNTGPSAVFRQLCDLGKSSPSHSLSFSIYKMDITESISL